MEEKDIQQLPITLTVAEFAKVLRIGRNTAYQIVSEGKIRSIKVGRQVRIPRAALLDYLCQA